MGEVRTRTAVITGGTGGIGLETAVALAGQGSKVTVVGRDAGRGEAARSRIDASGPETPTFIRAELSSVAAVRDLALEAAHRGAA